jgi:DNA-directed RNA polymerase specialized sigma24 family protein
MLEKLCLKDKIWRNYAFKICGCSTLADDLVQEMYLRIYKYNVQTDSNEYIFKTIRNNYLTHLKSIKTVPLNDYDLATGERHELDDNETKAINEMYWLAKDYIELNMEQSLREIQNDLNTNYGFIHRVIKKAKEEAIKTINNG